MSSNSNCNPGGRDEAAFQLSIPASDLSAIEAAAAAALQVRGQAAGPDFLRRCTVKEERQLNSAAQASHNNRSQNTTGQTAESSTSDQKK